MSLQLKPVIISALVLVSAFVFDSAAQNEAGKFTSKNTVYLELGGNVGRYAVNYGRLFYKKGLIKVFGSVGISAWRHKIGESSYWLPAIPFEAIALVGKTNHHLELGMGITPFIEPETIVGPGFPELRKGSNHVDAILPFRIGYRYQKPEGGFFFRVGYTPYFNLANKGLGRFNFQPIHAGIGLGKSF